MARLLRRLLYLIRRERYDPDLAEELEAHRAMAQARFERSGMSREEAAAASRRAMGNITLAREDARGVWIWPWLESVWQDLVYAVRSLRRDPQFALIAGGTLAAAIGLNTSLFTVYSAMAWRPWPVPENDRVVNVVSGTGAGGFSYPAFRYLAEHSTAFESLFAERRAGNNVLGEERLRVSWVSRNYFATLRVPMAIGRGFDADDERAREPAATVLQYDVWKARFSSDPAIVGRTITIDDVPVTVAGVASRDFSGTMQQRVDVWLPLSAAGVFRPNERWVREELSDAPAPNARMFGYLAVSGRLAPGATWSQAQTELNLLAGRFEPLRNGWPHRIRIFDTTGAHGLSAAPFIRMLAAVVTVLLLACANVGNLLVARAGARRREIAVRLSLGASRRRLVRQLLTESLVLAIAAGAAGILVALYLPRLVIEWASGTHTALQLRPDFAVIGFTLVLCMVTCLLFGLAPALHATRGSVSTAVKDDSQVAAGLRFSLRNLLLSVQVALSVVLLVGAGLLIRGVQRAHALDHGFRIDGVTLMSFDPPASSYDAARTRTFALQLAEQVETLSRGAPVALAHVAPFGSGNIKGSYRLPGSTEDEFNTVYEVSSSYFSVLGLPLVAGRVFGPADRGAILVNETLARRFGSPSAAVGRTISSAPDGGWNLPGVLQIVGVVRDANRTVLEEIQPIIYQPLSGRTIPQVLVGDSPGAAARISALATELDPRIRVRLAALSDNIQRRLDGSRAAATVATSLGALALTLAAVGMFSVFAFWVQQRTKEIGIRMALGARGSQVIHLVLESSGRSIASGLTIGFAGAIVAGRILRSSLYGVSPVDPIAYGGVALLLIGVSVTATFVPARRATRVDPIVALRYE